MSDGIKESTSKIRDCEARGRGFVELKLKERVRKFRDRFVQRIEEEIYAGMQITEREK